MLRSPCTIFCLAHCLVLATASELWPAGAEWTEISATSAPHPLGYTVHSATYLSPMMNLKPGQMVFTNPRKTPLKMPEGGSMITGFHGEVVDGSNASVPLSFVYDHHWIAEDANHKNDLCPGFENYVFGIGAESRNSAQTFPKGYGYPIPESDVWGGNIHLLHTQNLSTKYTDGNLDRAAKECNECYYAPNKEDGCTVEKNGTFQCCGDKCYDGSCSCPAVADLPASPYYLQYTVNYVKPAEASQLKDVRAGVWTTPNCAAYYNVLRNDAQPESLSSTEFTIPHDGEVIHAVGHQHTGAINISMWLNDEFVCASYPRYGTEADVAGNELGHLVAMSTCLDKDTSGKTMKTKKGDKVRIDSYYWVGSQDPRLGPSPAGTHLNVMAYMYTVFDIDASRAEPSDAERAARQAAAGFGCNAALIEPCGQFIGTGAACMECAEGHIAALALANCSVAHVEATCQGVATTNSVLTASLPLALAPYTW